jgi:hypothetical protein
MRWHTLLLNSQICKRRVFRPLGWQKPAAFPCPEPPLAGKRQVLAEMRVPPLNEPSILGLQARSTQQEGNMATRQTNSGKAQSVLGMAIVAVGILVLVPKFIAVAPLLSGTFQEISLQAFNALPALGLGALHAGQALVFDPGTFFAGVARILVSFWPLLVVALGTLILRNDSGIWSRALETRESRLTDEGR